MIEIKELKSNNIYLTKTPAKIIDYEIKKVLIIKMTSGGGMGGASWTETVEPTELKEGLNTVIDAITGEKIILNTMYIVKAYERQLITVVEVHQNPNFENTRGKPIKHYYTSKLKEDIRIHQVFGYNWYK